MPTYKNVAPRIVGVTVENQRLLVEPGRTVECSEAEAELQLKKGALALASDSSSAPAPEAPPPKQPSHVAPSGRTQRPKTEPKE